jgi:hypothetical protein
VSDDYFESTYPDGDGRLRLRRRHQSRRAKAEAGYDGYDRLPHLNDGQRRLGGLGTLAVLAAVVTPLWFYLQPYVGDLVSGSL